MPNKPPKRGARALSILRTGSGSSEPLLIFAVLMLLAWISHQA